jgi:large subunit ribosomal protein L9
MKIVLLEKVEKLGAIGDVVEVKAGFARNFLFPKQKALRATQDNIAYFESKRAQIEAENLQKKTDAISKAENLKDITLIIIRQASESGHLYGSVTARDISQEITKLHFPVERHQIRIGHPIKELGVHRVALQLHPEVSIEVIVSIAPSEEEAQALLLKDKKPSEEKAQA